MQQARLPQKYELKMEALLTQRNDPLSNYPLHKTHDDRVDEIKRRKEEIHAKQAKGDSIYHALWSAMVQLIQQRIEHPHDQRSSRGIHK